MQLEVSTSHGVLPSRRSPDLSRLISMSWKRARHDSASQGGDGLDVSRKFTRLSEAVPRSGIVLFVRHRRVALRGHSGTDYDVLLVGQYEWCPCRSLTSGRSQGPPRPRPRLAGSTVGRLNVRKGTHHQFLVVDPVKQVFHPAPAGESERRTAQHASLPRLPLPHCTRARTSFRPVRALGSPQQLNSSRTVGRTMGQGLVRAF